jgi:hypothetical protein
LAIAVSTTEVKAEPLEASGVAVAFCFFFAKESCVSMLESKRNNKKPAKKVIGLRGYERREYNWNKDFQRVIAYVSQWTIRETPSTPLRVTVNEIGPRKPLKFKRQYLINQIQFFYSL